MSNPRFSDRPPLRHWHRWIAVAVIGLVVSVAWAQTASDPTDTAPPPAATDNTVVVETGMPTPVDLFWKTNPWINMVLLLMSIGAVAIFVFMLLNLTRESFAPARFIDDVTKLVLGRNFDQAVTLCRNQRNVFSASVIQRCIENRDKPTGVVLDLLTHEGRRQADVIWNRIGYLGEIANIAPMLGLLGAVLGMIHVFFDLNQPTLGFAAAGLSHGIATAMATTLFGLIVAILAGVLYVIARGRATRVLTDTEQACHTVADHLHRAVEPGK